MIALKLEENFKGQALSNVSFDNGIYKTSLVNERRINKERKNEILNSIENIEVTLSLIEQASPGGNDVAKHSSLINFFYRKLDDLDNAIDSIEFLDTKQANIYFDEIDDRVRALERNVTILNNFIRDCNLL